jgi:lipopolysaccharide transport system ATP-binding protein
VGGGIWEAARKGQFLHRVVDYLNFRVIATKPVHPVGLCDLADGAEQGPPR